MKYPEFQQIIDTMVQSDYDYKAEIQIMNQNIQKRDSKGLSISDHVKSMVYAQLSNNRPWKQIEKNIAKINAIFYEFDVEILKNIDPTLLVSKLTAPDMHCGNRQISHQMKNLKANIETLEKIQTNEGGIDLFYKSTTLSKLVATLSLPTSEYKLKYMGVPLVCEYLKGVGIDVVKPDVHVCRLVGRLGYSKKQPAGVWETIEICKEISEEYNIPQSLVDTILWQYCAKNKFEVCAAEPKCIKCGVLTCPSRAL